MKPLPACLFFFALPCVAQADCFDRQLLVTRYHYPVPSTVDVNWQEVYLFDMGASTTTRLSAGVLADPQYDTTGGSFAPNGSRAAVAVSDDGGVNGRLITILPTDSDGDLQGDGAADLTTAAETPDIGGWSVDGLLFITPDDPDTWQVRIGTLNPAGTVLLSETTLAARLGYKSHAQWVGGGSHVVHVIDEVMPNDDVRRGIDAVEVATGFVTRLTSSADLITTATVDPVAGRVIYSKVDFSQDPPQLDLWQADLDLSGTPALSNATALTTSPGLSEHDPAVSPDGACLAYLGDDMTVTDGPNSDLYIRDLSSGETRRVTITKDISGAVFRP